MKRRSLLIAAGIAVCGWVFAAAAMVPWLVDTSGSRLEFTAEQAGAKFVGAFTRFKPQIVFDPHDLASSRFVVDVDAASVNTQDPDRDDALRGSDFFNVARWPKAHFETGRFAARADGSFDVTGKLTIRDVTREVPLHFEFAPGKDGHGAILTGSTRLKRLEFGLGANGDLRDTRWIGDDVEVRFTVRLLRP
jgi:polyisoprenoid-binding protein YceI